MNLREFKEVKEFRKAELTFIHKAQALTFSLGTDGINEINGKFPSSEALPIKR